MTDATTKASDRPTCLACGRRLDRYETRTYLRTETVEGRRRNIYRTSPIERQPPYHLRRVWPTYADSPDLHATADGKPPMFGGVGDNVFCTVNCGWAYAVKALIAVGGPQQFDELMPPDWRAQCQAETSKARERAKAKQHGSQTSYVAVAREHANRCADLGWAALSIAPFELARGTDRDEVLSAAVEKAGHDDIHIETRA